MTDLNVSMYGQKLGAMGCNAAVAMTETSRPHIQVALETLDQVIAHLEESAQQLTRRLDPIMVPQPQNTARGDDNSSAPPRSPVTQRIEGAAIRLATLSLALDQLTHSLEI